MVVRIFTVCVVWDCTFCFCVSVYVYTGMLSKSKGQILRVSACLHVLFHIGTPLDIPDTISDDAIKAAIDVVDVCIQHAAFLAGRGEISDIIEEIGKGM